MIVINLPQERVRAEVRTVLPDDSIIAQVVVHPFGKTHNFKFGDFVICNKVTNQIETIWQAEDKAFNTLEAAEDTAMVRFKKIKKKRKHDA